MSKKSRILLSVVFIVMASCSLAFAQTINPSANESVIYGCVTGINGNIVKVSSAPKNCPKGTSSISWNKIGPQGEIGPQGVPGPKGETGASYLDNIPVLNDNSNQEFIMQFGMTFEGMRCDGGSYLLGQLGYGPRYHYCLRELPAGEKLTFLDIEAADGWSGSAVAFRVLPETCPTYFSQSAIFNPLPEGYLVKNSQPFSYLLNGENNCLVLFTRSNVEPAIHHISFRVDQN